MTNEKLLHLFLHLLFVSQRRWTGNQDSSSRFTVVYLSRRRYCFWIGIPFLKYFSVTLILLFSWTVLVFLSVPVITHKRHYCKYDFIVFVSWNIPFLQVFSEQSVILNVICYARRDSVNDFPISGACSIPFYYTLKFSMKCCSYTLVYYNC